MLVAARGVFAANGYAGTSVDDLVQALNLHRGSLYKAFGSKRGLFLAVLTDDVTAGVPAALVRGDDLVATGALDLILVAAADLGPNDPEVAALVQDACHLIRTSSPRHPRAESTDVAVAVLGGRLLARMTALHDAPDSPAVQPV